MSRLALAEGYAARHWSVFPCRVNEKAPATRSGLYAGTDDLVTVRRYWRTTDYNIGINCGDSGLFVIDLDVNPENGDPGIAHWLEFAKDYGIDWESTYCVVTPKTGLHIYWSTPLPLRCSTSELRPNIDTRGRGGYVVAAGSEIDGVAYEHILGDQVLPVPSILAERFAPRPERTIDDVINQARYEVSATTSQRENAIRGLVDVVLGAGEHQRNNSFNWACWQVANHNWSDAMKEDAWGRLESAARSIGLTDSEIRDTLKSARRGQ